MAGAAWGNEGKQACKIGVAAWACECGSDGGGGAITPRSAVGIEGNAINCDIATVDK